MMNLEMSGNKPKSNESRDLWRAYIRDFAEQVSAQADEGQAMSLDQTGGEEGFFEDALTLACQHPEKFKTQLVELLRSLSLIGSSILFDPIHHGGLYLDRFGEVMVSLGDQMDVDFSNEKSAKTFVRPVKALMLTGPQAGREKNGSDIDIAPRSPLTPVIAE